MPEPRPIPLDSWTDRCEAALGYYVPILNVENPPILSSSELSRLGFLLAASTLANDPDYKTNLQSRRPNAPVGKAHNDPDPTTVLGSVGPTLGPTLPDNRPI